MVLPLSALPRDIPQWTEPARWREYIENSSGNTLRLRSLTPEIEAEDCLNCSREGDNTRQPDPRAPDILYRVSQPNHFRSRIIYL